MYADWLGGVLARDLRALRRQIEAFANDADLWKTLPGISNSAGNLAMHLAGNIQHFIGTQLGHTGYQRDREAEFSRHDVSKAKLLEMIDASIAAVRQVMPTLTDDVLDREYPQKIYDHAVTTGDWLAHLTSHLTYHLGQIDYLRRMVTGGGSLPGMLATGELTTARKAAPA